MAPKAAADLVSTVSSSPPAVVSEKSNSVIDEKGGVVFEFKDKSDASSDPESHESTPSDGPFHQIIQKDGKDFLVSWTKEEETRVVRKADWLFLPIFSLMFTWMAIDRSNVSGVLTSTFLQDTGMTRDQANTGVSLLWLGIVLLEIPSNMVLHRVGPHYWLPIQVIVWGFIEVLQMFVTNASGWYAARLFLGLAESGFIPGSLYVLSQWYTQDELAKRTVIFFFGLSIAGAFGSLISAGALMLEGEFGLKGWHWIFIICGSSTIATGFVALAFVPKSPYHTNRLFGGLVPVKGWLSERDADVFTARVIKADPKKGQESTMAITFKDVRDVLLDLQTWPYLLVCLSGLQSINGLGTWGAVIIKSLGFTSIRANLLSAPMAIVSALLGLGLASIIDRFKRFGYTIMFVAVWTLAGLIALYHLPITTEGSWSFYAAYFVTVSAPSWQPLNVTWLSLNSQTPQKRAIAYAIYIGCSNLGGTYGNQVFRASDAPNYRTAWIACIALGAVWLATLIIQTFAFRHFNRKWASKARENPDEVDDKLLYKDRKGQKHRYYW